MLDFSFLGRRPAQVLTAVLLAQGVFYYSRVRDREIVPIIRPLGEFPQQVDDWRMTREDPIEKEVQEVLRADDTLSRSYIAPGAPPTGLFMAYFKTQRYGQKPHSPMNCLPGSGWEPIVRGTITIPVAGRAQPIEVNRYVVARGPHRSMVVYWYQSHDRVVASEYWAQIHGVIDAMRTNRSDTSIVRVVVPVTDQNNAASEAVAVRFVQSMFPHLQKYFPS